MPDSQRERLGGKVAADWFAVVVVLLGGIYTLAELSPSSYGVVLERLGAGNAGLVAGEPKEVRGDEWGIWTPYIQASVNNGFARVNTTSYYEEDLRNFYGLPLADWALIFKPYFWPFFLLAPARAFSIYHAFFIVACLIGYHRLFLRLGFRSTESAPLSVALFFTTYVQAWWTTYCQIIAGYPWILLLVMARIHPWAKTAWLAYLAPAWLLAHLYPPLHVSLALVGLATVVAWDRESLVWRNIFCSAAGLALGSAITVAYLWEVIPVMLGTYYPGRRISSGGGGTLLQWLAQVLPYVATSQYRHLTNANICEASTLGTHLPALALFFIDWRRAASLLRSDHDFRIGAMVLLAVVALTSAWILLPVPSVLGWPLLWPCVPGKRMWLACGLAILMLTLRFVRAVPLRIEWIRLAGFGGCVVAAWLAWEPEVLHPLSAGSISELAILAAVLVVIVLRGPLGYSALAGLATAVALTNAIGFGLFNPLQRARPIFERPKTELMERFDTYERSNPDGLLALGYFDLGAVLNGLGYRTPTHTLLAPRMPVFRRLYPDLEPSEIDRIFNRFQHIHLSAATRPELLAEDVVSIPAEDFHPPKIPVTVVEEAPDRWFPVGGWIDSRSFVQQPSGSHLLIQGWAALDLGAEGSSLQVIAGFPIQRVVAYPLPRHALASRFEDQSLILAGFAMRLEVPPGVDDTGRLCLLAAGPRGRPLLLLEQPMNDRCRRLAL